MGYFQNILLSNYRNFIDDKFNFEPGCNVIVGKNGSGKTNILEALSLFEKGRGFRKDKINNLININFKKNKFFVNSIFIDDDISLKVSVYNSDKNLKRILINNSKEIESIKYFESLFSIIYFLPEMERLFVSSPSIRRNFLDRLVYTYNKDYNLLINNYKKKINERQILLKKNLFDENWMNKIENDIGEYSREIYKKRAFHIETLNKMLKELRLKEHFSNSFTLGIYDEFLMNNPEIINNHYRYCLELKQNRKKDFFLGGCSVGPHKSDFVGINLDNNFNLNQLSTGQQKTVVILLIIAQSMYLLGTDKYSPIIFLDEVVSHLDETNRDLILYLIKELDVQVFMTGTNKNFFSFLSTKVNYCNISQL